MASVNYIVKYTTERTLGGPEERRLEIPIHSLSDEEKEKLKQIEISKLVNNPYFQSEMLRSFRNNGHHVSPVDWDKGVFTSELKDGSIFAVEIQVNKIYIDPDYDKRLKHQNEFFDKFIKNL